MLLIQKLERKIDGKIVNVDTAFLHSKPEEDICMNIPDGLESKNYECVLLKKAIYRLVQTAR